MPMNSIPATGNPVTLRNAYPVLKQALIQGANITITFDDTAKTVTFSAPAASGGGSVAWGAISGTLADQTDLQTALNAKADKATTLAGYGITDGLTTSYVPSWASISGKPTTVSGYGITDALTTSYVPSWSSISGKPTTVAGYGITDALTTSYVPTWASISGKPTTVAGYGITDALKLSGGALSGPLILAAPVAGAASINLPPGSAPTSPNDGDMWVNTTAQLIVRLGGASHGVTLNNVGQTLSGNNVFSGNNTFSGVTTFNAHVIGSGNMDLTGAISANNLSGTNTGDQDLSPYVLSASLPVLAHGTYTPTLTNVANIQTASPNLCTWMRVGNLVHVTGRIDIDPTSAAVQTQVRMSLPVASTFTNNGHLAGAGVSNLASQAMSIRADTATGTALFDGLPTSANSAAYFFTFSYHIE